MLRKLFLSVGIAIAFFTTYAQDSTKTISFDNRIGVHFNVLIRLVNIVFCWT